MNQRVSSNHFSQINNNNNTTAKTIPSRCMCCWSDDYHIKAQRPTKDVPKLIPSYLSSVRRTPSPELDDSVRVSVIKKPNPIDVPMIHSRKLSLAAPFPNKNIDDINEHRRSVSPTYRPYNLQYDRSRRIYDSLPVSRPVDSRDTGLIKRKKLTVLHSENDYRRTVSDSYVNYREIPSPGYPTSPRYMMEPASPESPQFVFTPYMESALRNKYCADLAQFPDLSRGIKKRHRTIFTPSQLRKLEEKFNECNFIVGEDRQMLATQLKLKEHQVKIWFQNRRTKVKQTAKDGSEKPTTNSTTASEIDVVS